MLDMTKLFRTRINYFLFVVMVTSCFSLATVKNIFAQQWGPCTDDVAKFCNGVLPGGGAIAKCLKANEGDLSSGCKQYISEVKKKAQAFQEACRGDVTRFCADVQPGGGRIVRCLKRNEARLSPECKAVMTR